MGRSICVGLLAAICCAAVAASPAGAATTAAYVACSPSEGAVPSHICLVDDEPAAFFESDTDVEYEICVDPPSAELLCTQEEQAEADTLYVHSIPIEATGSYLATWYVEGAEVASWAFRIDPRPTPTPPPPPAATIPPPAPPVPSAIGCAAGKGLSFLVKPSRCVVFRQNRRDRAHEILMKNLRWTGWGQAVATATGSWKRCAKGSCSSGPLKAIASEPVLACGHFAYTRLKVQLASGKRQRNYQLQLPTC